MTYEEVMQNLNKIGYERSTSALAVFSNNVVVNHDFSNENINHTILQSSKIVNSVFDNASLTGSLFNKCIFIDCSMKYPDLEYCKFYDCQFQSSTQKRFTASINHSSFINTHFTKTKFYGCSFAESYFDNCEFDKTKLDYSTLENALFCRCQLKGIDFSKSNLQYSEWGKNIFSECYMSISQPPYMIGGLDICQDPCSDICFTSSQNQQFSMEEYTSLILPLLLSEYENQEEFFPVANIYISMKKYSEAMTALKKGLAQAVLRRDFRIIKFYCKLIVNAKVFNAHTLHDFYHMICRMMPQGESYNAEMQAYIRNIGEIKNILFQNSKKPSLHVSFITNLFSKQADKMAIMLEKLFQVSKMDLANQCEIKLSENSPLLIDIDIHGTEENIEVLLPAFISLTHTPELLPDNSFSNKNIDLERQIVEFQSQCKNLGIILYLAEYYLDNCPKLTQNGILPYFYNGSLKRENIFLQELG